MSVPANHTTPTPGGSSVLIDQRRASGKRLASSGIGHATKSKIELGVGGKDGYFDDIKVWNAEAAQP